MHDHGFDRGIQGKAFSMVSAETQKHGMHDPPTRPGRTHMLQQHTGEEHTWTEKTQAKQQRLSMGFEQELTHTQPAHGRDLLHSTPRLRSSLWSQQAKCWKGHSRGVGTEAEVELAPPQEILLGVKVLLVHCRHTRRPCSCVLDAPVTQWPSLHLAVHRVQHVRHDQRLGCCSSVQTPSSPDLTNNWSCKRMSSQPTRAALCAHCRTGR